MSSKFATAVLVSAYAAGTTLAQPACPEAGLVIGQAMISVWSGGFAGDLDPGDSLGRGLTAIGDLDGDGITDLASTAPGDDDGGNDRGAVWILFLNSDGSVRSQQKISDLEGGFDGVLNDFDYFGIEVAALGDVDGDGIPDLVVAAMLDDDGGVDRGALWVLFMNQDGTVRTSQKISNTEGNFTGHLDNEDRFGENVAGLGDLDGDGVPDLAAAAVLDDDGGLNRGAVWILFLNGDGTVKAHQKISDTAGGFQGVLDDVDLFGVSLASLGDVDGDGTSDLAAGAWLDDDGGSGISANRGALWVLFMNSDGTVRAEQKISDIEGGLLSPLDDADGFGRSIAGVGDLDGDSVPDVAVGADGDDDGAPNSGAVYLLFLNPDGTIKAERKISQSSGGFRGVLNPGDAFGESVTLLSNSLGNGAAQLAVAANLSDVGGTDQGAIWVLALDTCATPPSIISQPEGILLGFSGGPATFVLSAVGDGSLTYQWRRNGVELADGAQFSGANSPTLSIAAGPFDEGLYDCVVSNAFGSVTSAPAVLAVLPNPCPADLTGNSLLDLNDINAFIQAFTGGCP